ncbi:E3 ubiquitin-protein ligase [Musa troglodytarum]|uniref:RING-type E3 ubiquitin transferase n=1 Tax=Musa troglodytarum TaxID=320322 RepID=A0A9E7HLU4_9LILI|nr:E3 ubiquitin-protein ligase [Musa troglodytarum]
MTGECPKLLNISPTSHSASERTDNIFIFSTRYLWIILCKGMPWHHGISGIESKDCCSRIVSMLLGFLLQRFRDLGILDPYVAPNFMCMIDVAVLVLFMILNSHQMSPNFLLWLVLGVFLMATSLRMYATCQQLQAQAQAHAAAASGFLGGTELRLHVPPSIAFATRGRLQSLRLQLALLDREFDDLDYDALRALDSDNPPDAPSMTEEEINSLPVHKYKLQSSSRQRQDPILYLYIVVDQCCNMHRLLQYLQLSFMQTVSTPGCVSKVHVRSANIG